MRCGLESLLVVFPRIRVFNGRFIGLAYRFLKPLIASPRDLPNSGSLLGPKTTRATTKITISSGMPRLPNIQHLLTKRPITLCFGVRDVNLMAGVEIWVEPP